MCVYIYIFIHLFMYIHLSLSLSVYLSLSLCLVLVCLSIYLSTYLLSQLSNLFVYTRLRVVALEMKGGLTCRCIAGRPIGIAARPVGAATKTVVVSAACVVQGPTGGDVEYFRLLGANESDDDDDDYDDDDDDDDDNNDEVQQGDPGCGDGSVFRCSCLQKIFNV